MVLICMGAGKSDTQPSTSPALPTSNQITKELTNVIDWYEHVTAFTNTPVSVDEALYRDGVKNSASEAVKLAFDRARAEAQMLATTEPQETGKAKAQTVTALAAAASQRIASLNAELADMDAQLSHGPTTQPADVLAAKRDKLQAELDLATERRSVLERFASILSGPQNGGAAELLQKIDELEQTVPGLPAGAAPSDDSASSNDDSGQNAGGGSADGGGSSGSKHSGSSGALATLATVSPAAAALNSATSTSDPSTAAAPAPFRPETAGIFGLGSELVTLSGRMATISDLIKEEEPIVPANDAQVAPLRAQLLAVLHQGDVLANTPDTANVQTLTEDTSQIEELSRRYNLLTGVLMPLVGESTNLKATADRLDEWHHALADMYQATLRSLLTRLAIMMGSILVVLIVSRLWQRATFRYVKEPRKRRVFLMVRRIVTTVLIGLILLLTFMSGEFSSIATFAGLITAGIAVALQSIILAGVAYFFVMGRYGIRIGDRITVNGITGDVVDTGLFRFYLMELSGSGFDLHPTGRIVVFSNAVLFQATSFYKQMPGADYTWHEVAMTLAPDSDYKLAQDVLLAAVQSVFNTYKDRIVEQHHIAASQVHLPMQQPEPQGRLRFVDAGLEFTIRYPVEISDAAEVDDQVTRTLLAKIQSEPKLKMVVSGTPKIQKAA